MNPHQKPQEDVVVTQEDREAGAQAWGYQSPLSETAIRIRAGEDDANWIVQSFARHRLLGHEAGRRDMREAAGKVAFAQAVDRDAAVIIRDAIRNLPTEPLGGEPPRDNFGPE